MGCYIHVRVKFPDMKAMEFVASNSEALAKHMDLDDKDEKYGSEAIATLSDPAFQKLLPAFDRNMLNLYLTEHERSEAWKNQHHQPHRTHVGTVLILRHFWKMPSPADLK